MNTALIDRDGAVTYRELDELVARMRGALAGRGVGRGDAVLIVTANDRASAATYRAVVDLGATAVLSQVGAGTSELQYAYAATKPVLAVLSRPAFGLELPEAVPVVPVAELEGAEPVAAASIDVDAPAVIIFTSGTTSTPKGVVHSARSLHHAVACFQAMMQLVSNDRIFLVSPLASITGVLQALELAPSVGATAVLEQSFSDDGSLELLVSAGATAYGGPDLVLGRLLAAADRRGVEVPLRIAALGGTMLRRELIESAEHDFGIRVVRVYGSSEAPCSTGTRPHEPDELRLGDEGVPGPDVELRLSGDGELLVRGPHVFLGYVSEADNDDAVVDGWFRTGDEAEIIDGRLRIIGRLKDVVSRNGKKISLAEVDQAFTAACGIADSAAFGVTDERTGERVAMAVRLPKHAHLDVAAVHAAMEAAGVTRWKLPESIVRYGGPLPTTATGKVQRRALTEDGDVLWCADRLRTLPRRTGGIDDVPF